MTRITGDKASERDNELVLRKKENILFFARHRITIEDPEDTFDYQSKIVTDDMLHVEEVVLFDLPGLPVCPAVGNIFIGQRGEAFQVGLQHFVVFAHSAKIED